MRAYRLKGLIGNGKTYVDPLTEAVDASTTALDIFVQAGRDLDAANEKLELVVEDEKAAIAAAQQRVAHAEEQHKRNDRVKAKIDEFIVE